MDLPLILPEILTLEWAGGLVLASFFTSALTAAFGIGGGIAMLALMGLAMPFAALIPVHGAVQLGSNTGRAYHQRAHISKRIAWPFLVGSIIGAVAGTLIVLNLPDNLMKLLLGIFVIISVWAKLPGFQHLKAIGIAAGSAIIAFLSMIIGASGPMLLAFFSKIFPDDRKKLVATHAAGMSVHHGLKVVLFAIAGFAFWQWIPFLAAMIASGYLGTIWGTKLLHKMPEDTFRLGFKLLLTFVALDLIRRGVFGFLGV